MKPLLVLAGGFGTRLRSIVSDVPKPLAPVSGRPFISYLVNHWVKQGVKEFVFLLHYDAHKFEKVFGIMSSDPKFKGISFKTVIEKVPLGTGGAILNAIHELNISDSFLVANADTWLGTGVQLLSKNHPCALAAVYVPDSERYGSLLIRDSQIISFQEKATLAEGAYVNSGIYHLLPTTFDEFVVGSSFSLEEDVLPGLVSAKKLGVVTLNTSFIDIGIPDDYFKFCEWIDSGRKNDL